MTDHPKHLSSLLLRCDLLRCARGVHLLPAARRGLRNNIRCRTCVAHETHDTSHTTRLVRHCCFLASLFYDLVVFPRVSFTMMLCPRWVVLRSCWVSATARRGIVASWCRERKAPTITQTPDMQIMVLGRQRTPTARRHTAFLIDGGSPAWLQGDRDEAGLTGR
jgi:hypothetical protein